MKFKKYQTMFALGTPWQDDVVNYAEMKKLIYSHVIIPSAPTPTRKRSNSKFVTSVTCKTGGGGGILAELDEMNEDESEDEVEDNIQMPQILECETQLRILLQDNVSKCNVKWDELVGHAQQYAIELQSHPGAPTKDELQKLRMDIYYCFDYSRIQFEAFQCILKKWDKHMRLTHTKSELNSESYLATLGTERFMDRSLLDVSLRIAQELMMRQAAEAVVEPTDSLDYSSEEYDKRIVVDKLDIDKLVPSTKHRIWLSMIDDGFTCKLKVPVIVVKGAHPGPVLLITACVHGDELNGVPVVHKLVDDIDPVTLVGTIVAIPVVNGPGFLENKRGFSDGVDLNRCFPGQVDGNRSKQYAFAFINKVIRNVDYLIDLHTASHGRVNSLYVRADMLNPMSKQMALLQNPNIIVHNSSPGGSLRGSAQNLGIPAITVEIGDPSKLQFGMIRKAYQGVYNILTFLNMLTAEGDARPPVVKVTLCTSSRWFFTDTGGILVVHPKVNTWIRAGQPLATIFDPFGDKVKEFFANEDCVVIGKSVNPVASAGDRIAHLGFVEEGISANQLDGHE